MGKDLVSNVYLFKGLPSDELNAIVKIAGEDKYKTGQIVFAEGDAATALFIIRYGSVKIAHSSPHGDDINVATLGTGSHFGEMAFLDGHKRTGTAIAMEDCEILRLDYKKLEGLFEKNPKMAAHFYRALSLFLCGRLENTTRDLTFAREKRLKAA